MATARPFAYNPGTAIPGTEQLGNLSIGIPTSGFTETPQYWNGPDEDLGYIIAKPISGNTQPTPLIVITASVGFGRSPLKTEESFVEYTNSIFGQSFTTGSQAKTWLNDNGYWTSYDLINPTPSPTSTPTPSPTSTPTPTPSPTSIPVYSGACNEYFFGIDTFPGESTIFGYYEYPSGTYEEVLITAPDAIFANAYSYPGVFYVSGDTGYTIENYGPCSTTPTPTPTGTPAQTPTPTPTDGGVTCIQIVDTVIYPVPQTGINNFFGVNVAVNPYPVSEDVTVTGYIRDDGNPSNIYNFSITITSGNQSGETANNVLTTGPADTATIFVTGVTPTAVNYLGVSKPICGFEPDPNECIVYEIDNSGQPSEIEWTGLLCITSASVGGTVPANTVLNTGCIIEGTLNTTGSPIISIVSIC
jgi:hypothetical protein